jgi:hypothetical protein
LLFGASIAGVLNLRFHSSSAEYVCFPSTAGALLFCLQFGLSTYLAFHSSRDSGAFAHEFFDAACDVSFVAHAAGV